MRRVLLALVLLGIGLAGAYGLFESRKANAFRQLIDRGEAALAAGDTLAALEDFSGAVALRPTAMLGYLRRGEVYHRRMDDEAALRDLTRAVALDPTATRAWELKGDVERTLLRYDRAADTYRGYLALDDQSPRLLYKLALAEFHRGRPKASIEALDRALRLDGNTAQYHYLRGLSLLAAGNVRDGRAALQQAVGGDPTFLLAREELAAAYGRSGETGRQIEQLEALLALDPRPARAAALARAQARRGQLERAVGTLRSAAERFPDSPDIFATLGQIWLSVASMEHDDVPMAKARQALERAVAAGPDSESLLALGRLERISGNLAAAERVLQQAASRRPVTVDALSELAQVASRLKHPAIARRALLDRLALIGEPADPPARAALALRLAALSTAVGEPDEAAAWYRRAAEDDETASTLAALAEAELKAGNREAARTAAERALARDPSTSRARWVVRQLR